MPGKTAKCTPYNVNLKAGFTDSNRSSTTSFRKAAMAFSNIYHFCCGHDYSVT